MTTTNTTSNVSSIVGTNFTARHPLLSFFTLAIIITWLLSLPALLFELPFKPLVPTGHCSPR